LETFLINLSRGTEGFDRDSRTERKVRPLLAFSQEEIEEYAKFNTIQWREDSSNASINTFEIKFAIIWFRC
jgi:tRNA(Ile)-lysidine synthase